MDDAAIAAAICARLAAVAPPPGEHRVRWAGHTLAESPVAARPAIELMPPDEQISWGPSGRMSSTSTWRARLLLGQQADLPRRMAALYAWRTALRAQLAGQVGLGLGGRVSAELSGMRADLGGDDIVLEMTIRVSVRETVVMAP